MHFYNILTVGQFSRKLSHIYTVLKGGGGGGGGGVPGNAETILATPLLSLPLCMEVKHTQLPTSDDAFAISFLTGISEKVY